jgi:hypothetical protein
MPNSWKIISFEQSWNSEKKSAKKNQGIPQLLKFKQARDAKFLKNYLIFAKSKLGKKISQRKFGQLLEFKQAQDAQFLEKYLIFAKSKLRKEMGHKKLGYPATDSLDMNCKVHSF